MIDALDLILEEIKDSLNDVNDENVDHLVNCILQSDTIIVVGVGRVMISLKAWVKRLKHLGVKIDYFGSETEGNVSNDDLVIVGSSSGESLIPRVIAEKAKSVNARVYYVGCSENSTVDQSADYRLILPGKTKYNRPSDFNSKQPMSTLFEQQLYLLGDIIALKIMNIKKLEETDVKRHHANLE